MHGTILAGLFLWYGAVPVFSEDPGASVEQGQSQAGTEEHDSRLLRTSSRAPYVHRLTLYDHDGTVISPDDVPARPYSPRVTCGKCHPVAQIECGWHFNGNQPDVDPGRPGEPWIVADPQTGTQLPVSWRGWPGTYVPAEIGLSQWQFLLRFGRHIPGGGVGQSRVDLSSESPQSARWGISGELEIDCMVCHSGDTQHDPAEAARQIEKENFKWSATAALALAVVRGEARRVPDDWDAYAPPNLDYPDEAPPTIIYDRSRFDADDRVLFNITRRPDAGRCYFCHTVRRVAPGNTSPWQTSEDVHLAAGMACTHCHRNDIDHMIVRGYAGEAGRRNQPLVAAFSCVGCHLGSGEELGPIAGLDGLYGAPRPLHRGIPSLHFDRLTCTVCHSGPWPVEYPRRIQTSMAHGLGLATKERREDDWPRIFQPIFAEQTDGRIAPHRMIWPGFWGRMHDDTITPVRLEIARRAVDAVRARPENTKASNTPLSSEQIAQILDVLAGEHDEADGAGAQTRSRLDGAPVYVHEGYVYRRDSTGRVERVEHSGAMPYLWPLGHDVRPAVQSLGVRGCTDCHAEGAPFYFGKVFAADDSAAQQRIDYMYELQGVDATLVRSWVSSFAYRGAYRWGSLACIVLVGAVLCLYGSHGLAALLRRFGQ